MKYFNGFSLLNEEKLFHTYIDNSENSVCGFSYGAIKAFEYACNIENRVDKVILISPAFFQISTKSFKKTQLLYFKKDPKSYMEQFSKNIALPSSFSMKPYIVDGSIEELEELLNYEWLDSKLKLLQSRGTTIEVFLGKEDKIVDTKTAYDFFSKVTTTHLLDGVGHILKA